MEMTTLEGLIATNPTKDYAVSLLQCTEMTKELMQILKGSTIPLTHGLWTAAKDLKKRDQELQSREAALIVVDSKDSLKTGKPRGPYRLPKVNLPTFNGELKNWHHFWVQFKDAVHNNSELSNPDKLVYLRQSMEDPALKELLCCEMNDPGFYTSMLAVLRKRFDQPRKLHSVYCRTLADLQPVKHTAHDLSQVADTVFAAVTGIARQGQATIQAIATSLVSSVLPKQLRMEWETLTEKSKDVPDIFQWVEFVRATRAWSKR